MVGGINYTYREVELLQWFARRAEVELIVGLLEAERCRLEVEITKATIIFDADRLRARTAEVRHILIILKEEKSRIKEGISKAQNQVEEGR